MYTAWATAAAAAMMVAVVVAGRGGRRVTVGCGNKGAHMGLSTRIRSPRPARSAAAPNTFEKNISQEPSPS
jgi:hypothetical protein